MGVKGDINSTSQYLSAVAVLLICLALAGWRRGFPSSSPTEQWNQELLSLSSNTTFVCWEGISVIPVYLSILSPQRPQYIYMRSHTSGERSEILYPHWNWGEGGSILGPIVSDGVKGICTLKSRLNAGSQSCYYRRLPEVLRSAPAFIQPMLPVKSLGSLCKQELQILPPKYMSNRSTHNMQ